MMNNNGIDLNPTNSNTNSNSFSFQPGYNDANAMQWRLGTDEIKAKIQIYLQGKAETFSRNEDGTFRTDVIMVGEPLVNDIGLQNIMMKVEQCFNSATVQGNFSDESFGLLMYQFRVSLADNLWVNMHKYGIEENAYNGLTDFLFYQMKIFLTRTLNNGERNSYGQSLQIKDSSTSSMVKKRTFLSGIFGG